MTKKAIADAFEHLRAGEEMQPLEAAARSRSEADWLVGMNATRAASIRLRAAFDGVVSLGRVQTPTLALVAAARGGDPRVQARALLARRGRLRGGRRAPLRGPLPRRQADRRGARGEVVEECTGRRGEITKLERRRSDERRSSSTTSPRSSATPTRCTASPRSARSAAAQKLYEQHKAITYPRTNSRWLSATWWPRSGPPPSWSGHNPRVPQGAEYVTALDELPLGRVVNDKKVEDHHAIIPTKSEHDLVEDGPGRAQGLRPGRAALPRDLPPDAVFERTRVETTVAEHVFRTSGRVLVDAGLARRSTARRPNAGGAGDDDSGGNQSLPKLEQGEAVDVQPRGVAAQGDPAAAALHRGLAARRDGDRGQGHRGRRGARGDEGLRHRHPGHPRLDHRAADHRRLHRARGPRPAWRPRRASR